MDEELKKEAEKEEPEKKPDDNDNGVQPSSTPFLDMANSTAKRIEKAAKDINEAQDRREKYDAKLALGGTAGGHVEATPKEETPKEYNDRVEKEISEGKHDE